MKNWSFLFLAISGGMIQGAIGYAYLPPTNKLLFKELIIDNN